ncbi:MAG: ABC transporter substrate-binding protein [Spirochaetales bacterium]|nr:ABC transporter substrate-binding protein [Spirochaetales bacterium]
MGKMNTLGYIEGKNIVYDLRQAYNDAVQARQICEKFIKDNVDLIFAFSTQAAVIAKNVTEKTKIPLIFTIVNIEDTGIIKSIQEPGGNITGVRSPSIELPVKNLEIMLELLPDLKKIYLPYAANYPAIYTGLKALHATAKTAGISVTDLPVSELKDLENDLKARDSMQNIGIEAILCLPESLVQSPEGFKLLSDFADKHKIPIGGLIPWEITKGATYVTGIDMHEMGQLAAPLADKVLKGTKAGTIPVVSPELHLRINYKRALELGITVPKGLLLQADEIIR